MVSNITRQSIQLNTYIISYDIFEVELSMLKPLLFNPESIKDTIMFTNNQYIYIIGRMKNYDDCIIFKTNINNLSLKWDYSLIYKKKQSKEG